MFALVQNGVVTRTWESIPSRLDNVMAFHLMPEAERNLRGFYSCVDQRPALQPGESYGPSAFAWDGTKVVWTASVIPPSQDFLDSREAREYAPLQALAAMTPTQIQAYINANVTDLASAKVALRTLAVAVGIMARRI
jgi:hypothetical protein